MLGFLLAAACLKYIIDMLPVSSGPSTVGAKFSSLVETKYGTSNYTSADYAELTNESSTRCATWLQNNRRVLLVGFQPVDELSWMTEEYHMSMNLVGSLLKLEFDLHHVGSSYFENMKDGDLRFYHRIFVMHPSKEDHWSRHFDHREIGCKIRVLLPDIDEGDDRFFQKLKNHFHEKQLLVASSHEGTTYLGYYPVLPKGIARPVSSERHKMGIIVLPVVHAKLSTKETSIVNRLLEMGISLHVLYRDRTYAKSDLPSGIINHEYLSQEATLNLLSQSAFMLSFGDIVPTPLPIIAISFGVSVINLTNNRQSQLPFLSEQGMPYIYNVNEYDVDGIISTVQYSFSYRFVSHIILSSGLFEDRVCALVEDDSICLCPPEKSVDCRSSFYMMKQPAFPAIN